MTLVQCLSRSRPAKLLSGVLMKFWALSGVYIFGCFLLYWLYGGVLTFVLTFFAITSILYHMEDKLVYKPESPTHARVYVPSPSQFSLPYQSIYIRARDGTMLHAFFIPQKKDLMSSAPTLLYLHGNAGNIGHRLPNVVGLYYKVRCNILMLEYRGYGFSQGSPSEEGLYMDAQAGFQYLMSRGDIDQYNVIVFGRSLGGAVAIDLASKPEISHKIWCLIVENTFTDIPEMASVLVKSKLLSYLPLICYKNKYLSLMKVKSVTLPTLFISGLADALVPPRMMLMLLKRCRSCFKIFIGLQGGSHMETWRQPGYYENINKFLQDLRDKPPVRSVVATQWLVDDV